MEPRYGISSNFQAGRWSVQNESGTGTTCFSPEYPLLGGAFLRLQSWPWRLKRCWLGGQMSDQPNLDRSEYAISTTAFLSPSPSLAQHCSERYTVRMSTRNGTKHEMSAVRNACEGCTARTCHMVISNLRSPLWSTAGRGSLHRRWLVHRSLSDQAFTVAATLSRFLFTWSRSNV